MTRLELLEKVNELNLRAQSGDRYWAVTVMYNVVIWRGGLDRNAEPYAVMHEVVGSVFP